MPIAAWWCSKGLGNERTQTVKLTAADAAAAGDLFGYRAAISGDTAIVGGRNDDDGGNNSAQPMTLPAPPANLDPNRRLTAADSAPNDFFGFSVAISGGKPPWWAVIKTTCRIQRRLVPILPVGPMALDTNHQTHRRRCCGE